MGTKIRVGDTVMYANALFRVVGVYPNFERVPEKELPVARQEYLELAKKAGTSWGAEEQHISLVCIKSFTKMMREGRAICLPKPRCCACYNRKGRKAARNLACRELKCRYAVVCKGGVSRNFL
jgi:adenine-specific DNA glycosylase